MWFLLLLLFPSLAFSYPELISKNCASCHSEASGYGILTVDGKNSALNSAHKKYDNYYEIKTPAWLAIGVKADLNQSFNKTPYEESGSFKATRAEVLLGLKHAVDTYLTVTAQGSLNRVDPKSKSDSITDYVYSPYRYVEIKYADDPEEGLALKHGFYRNEWQNDFSPFQTSFKQSELIWTHKIHQLNLGYIAKTKTYNDVAGLDSTYINYKFLHIDRYALMLGHQLNRDRQLTSLRITGKKSENLTIKMFIAQTVISGNKGIKAHLKPVYQYNSYFKGYVFAEYQNNHIKTAKPRTIIYGLGGDYLWLPQGLLSVIYSKTDDSVVLANPSERVEFNFHLYM